MGKENCSCNSGLRRQKSTFILLTLILILLLVTWPDLLIPPVEVCVPFLLLLFFSTLVSCISCRWIIGSLFLALSSTLLERFGFWFIVFFPFGKPNPLRFLWFVVLLGLVYLLFFIFIFHTTVPTTVYVMILTFPRFFNTLPEPRL